MPLTGGRRSRGRVSASFWVAFRPASRHAPTSAPARSPGSSARLLLRHHSAGGRLLWNCTRFSWLLTMQITACPRRAIKQAESSHGDHTRGTQCRDRCDQGQRLQTPVDSGLDVRARGALPVSPGSPDESIPARPRRTGCEGVSAVCAVLAELPGAVVTLDATLGVTMLWSRNPG
jgi:hypothetical protein